MQEKELKGTEQSTLWNGVAGRVWVELQELLDQTFRALEDEIVTSMTSASIAASSRVLDVGCGTGTTTLAVARRLSARCTGVDISEPMLARARARAEREGLPVEFAQADAQSHAFERAVFDAIVSRFGVMFFTDPIEAFTNLRGAAKEKARLHCIVWRTAAENPFMTTAERAAAPLLPALPSRKPDEPGQFAFGDRDRVRRLLSTSGWSEIEIEPVDYDCSMPEKELVRYLTQLGPVGRALMQANDDELRTRVVEVARPAFEPWVQGSEVRFVAACWRVKARA